MNGRAVAALWIVCAVVIAWVWLRPLHEGTLPAPPKTSIDRAARKARLAEHRATVAQPEDEPVAEDPAAAPVQAGPPEQLNRHELEAAMDKVKPKVLACRDVEQYSGFVIVKLVIDRSGGVKSANVEPPVGGTKTGDCVKKALRTLSFPRFRGTYIPQIEWRYPFMLGESAPAAR